MGISEGSKDIGEPSKEQRTSFFAQDNNFVNWAREKPLPARLPHTRSPPRASARTQMQILMGPLDFCRGLGWMEMRYKTNLMTGIKENPDADYQAEAEELKSVSEELQQETSKRFCESKALCALCVSRKFAKPYFVLGSTFFVSDFFVCIAPHFSFSFAF